MRNIRIALFAIAFLIIGDLVVMSLMVLADISIETDWLMYLLGMSLFYIGIEIGNRIIQKQ